MHNFFTLVGPSADPAGVRAQSSVLNALRRIAATESLFMSRGDDSGTHQMEKRLWTDAGITPEGSWIQESGQGMGATLGIASEKSGYTLTDMGTYLALRRNLHLEIVMGQDPALLNTYSVLELSHDRFPKVNSTGGRAFAEYLVSPEAQAIIDGFGVEEFGSPLFFPDAGKTEDELRG
jgi:tungstate transport system substrate-binding protein